MYSAFLSSNHWKTSLDKYIYKILSSFLYSYHPIVSLQRGASNSVSLFWSKFSFSRVREIKVVTDWTTLSVGISDKRHTVLSLLRHDQSSASPPLLLERTCWWRRGFISVNNNNNNKNWHFWVCCRLQRTLSVFSHLIFTTILWGRYYFQVQIKKVWLYYVIIIYTNK